jgi:hypothetical protein
VMFFSEPPPFLNFEDIARFFAPILVVPVGVVGVSAAWHRREWGWRAMCLALLSASSLVLTVLDFWLQVGR